METISRDGLRLAYYDQGDGSPVLLLHGITVSYQRNFEGPGWVSAIVGRGSRVIGLDLRGHGASDKRYTPEAYGLATLADDALALLDHVGAAKAAVFGYSLGSAVALELLLRAPQRIVAAVLAGTGDGLIGASPLTMNHVASRLSVVLDRQEFPADLPAHESAYWNFAMNGGDRLACLAAAQASYPAVSAGDLGSVASPVLVVSGSADPVLGTGPRLAAAFPRAEYLEVAGADHFTLTRSPVAQESVANFLAKNGARLDA